MNLYFGCNYLMIPSDLGVNKVKTWIQLKKKTDYHVMQNHISILASVKSLWSQWKLIRPSVQLQTT